MFCQRCLDAGEPLIDSIEPAAVKRLYNRIDDEVREALRPFGYYDPHISSSIDGPDKDRHWRIGITIDPGPAVIIDGVPPTMVSSERSPSTEILPTVPSAIVVNHSPPSGPAAMPNGALPAVRS